MNHLIVCREYPPAPYPPGGIGTYVRHISGLLANSGDTVHVIAQRWEGAPAKTTSSHSGRLVVHRVSVDDAVDTAIPGNPLDSLTLRGLAGSDCPSQAFAWQVALLAETLAASEGVDLIEAPEWEAPLYYLQLRRALGLGPRRQPMCLIHLHSPSALIFRHNEWDLTFSDYEPLRRMEEYSVRMAGAVVCPSRYLAREAERLFGLAANQVHVIPYPLGDAPSVERDAKVWRRDAICYFGRLELRKGVVEWVDAAVKVAQSHSTVSFDFIGSDTSLDGGPGGSVRQYLQDRIPGRLRTRFHFPGSMSRDRLAKALAGAPVAVVPSRWENLPYSCIEAMCSGMPVLVTPAGGMSELVEDGESGWIAEDGSPAGLAAALRRVLDTPPPRREQMGRNAEKMARGRCSNETVLARHREWRGRLVKDALSRPVGVPPAGVPSSGEVRQGMAVLVTGRCQPQLLLRCLESIKRQSQPAALVAVCSARPIEALGVAGVEFIDVPDGCKRADALSQVLKSASRVRGIVFLDETVQLEPGCLSSFESAFERRPEVGLVSGFISREGRRHELDATPGRGSNWSLSDLETLVCAAVRPEVLQVAGDVGSKWTAITYPEIVASAAPRRASGHTAWSGRAKRYSAIALAQRASARLTLTWFLAAPWTEKARWLGQVFGQPRRTAHWVAWQLRAAAARTR